MRVALRPVREGDQPFLLGVYAGTRAEELALVPWSPEQKAAFVAQQFGAQTAHYARYYPGMSADVILIDDVPAGRLLVHRGDDAILIVDIALLPEHRGRGAGSLLLREVLSEAADAGKRVNIHVERQNRALGLYQRLGFRQVDEDVVYLLMEWDPPPGPDTTTRRTAAHRG
jgi:ribosomal protein S18 acetylase RimI-like enzyme